MEQIEDIDGKLITVSVQVAAQDNEYSLSIRFKGLGSLSASGNFGGDFTLYSMTPEAMVNLAMGIIEAAAKAKSARELDLVLKPAPEDLLRAEQEAKC